VGSPSDNPDATAGLIERAEALIDRGRSADAVPLLRQAVALRPDDATTHCWLALALHHTGDAADALRCADTGAGLSPDWEWPHRLRGIILLAQNKKRDALEAAAAALRLAPTDRDPLHLLANCQLELRRYDDARRTAAQLLELAPEWDFTHNLLGTIAGNQRRWRECEQHCLNALELNPESITALHNLGNSFRQTGRKREASECYRRALVLDPSDEEARRALLSLVTWEMAELPIWRRQQRLESEHPSVQTFVRDAQETANREVSSRLAVLWTGMGWLFTIGWTLLLIAFTRHGGLLHQWWEWASYLAVVIATLLGTATLIRKRRRDAT